MVHGGKAESGVYIGNVCSSTTTNGADYVYIQLNTTNYIENGNSIYIRIISNDFSTATADKNVIPKSGLGSCLVFKKVKIMRVALIKPLSVSRTLIWYLF